MMSLSCFDLVGPVILWLLSQASIAEAQAWALALEAARIAATPPPPPPRPTRQPQLTTATPRAKDRSTRHHNNWSAEPRLPSASATTTAAATALAAAGDEASPVAVLPPPAVHSAQLSDLAAQTNDGDASDKDDDENRAAEGDENKEGGAHEDSSGGAAAAAATTAAVRKELQHRVAMLRAQQLALTQHRNQLEAALVGNDAVSAYGGGGGGGGGSCSSTKSESLLAARAQALLTTSSPTAAQSRTAAAAGLQWRLSKEAVSGCGRASALNRGGEASPSVLLLHAQPSTLAAAEGGGSDYHWDEVGEGYNKAGQHSEGTLCIAAVVDLLALQREQGAAAADARRRALAACAMQLKAVQQRHQHQQEQAEALEEGSRRRRNSAMPAALMRYRAHASNAREFCLLLELCDSAPSSSSFAAATTTILPPISQAGGGEQQPGHGRLSSLSAVVSNGRLRESLARRLWGSALGALAALHAQGVVHGELSPSALLVLHPSAEPLTTRSSGDALLPLPTIGAIGGRREDGAAVFKGGLQLSDLSFGDVGWAIGEDGIMEPAAPAVGPAPGAMLASSSSSGDDDDDDDGDAGGSGRRRRRRDLPLPASQMTAAERAREQQYSCRLLPPALGASGIPGVPPFGWSPRFAPPEAATAGACFQALQYGSMVGCIRIIVAVLRAVG
eukprot:COSAG05_NODE_692_length_7897_cov_3.572454_3_plen_674_part_00